MYRLHKLLWELRRDPALAARFNADPDEVMRSYGLGEEEIHAIKQRDFGKLYRQGVNPYILYFGALQMGVSRPEYYERVRVKAVEQ